MNKPGLYQLSTGKPEPAKCILEPELFIYKNCNFHARAYFKAFSKITLTVPEDVGLVTMRLEIRPGISA